MFNNDKSRIEKAFEWAGDHTGLVVAGGVVTLLVGVVAAALVGDDDLLEMPA